MNRFSLQAVKALVLIGVVGSVVVGCNDVASVKAPLPAEENTPVAGVVANRNGSAMLTADEREAKKREFFAKPEVKEMSAGLEEIAQAVAVAVEDKTLRDRIYAKCMEKFDGETNVLWQQLEADANLRSKGGWSKKVDDLVGRGRKNATIKGIGNVDAAIKKFEKLIDAPLHLFWMYPSKWDKKTTPLVAFVPFDMDPSLRKTIPMFDGKGNRYELDQACTIAKERPVIIVNINERTNVDGTKKPYMLVSTHESRATSNTPSSAPSVTKKSTASLTFFSITQQLGGVTITYPYNRDEWGGGVEFKVQFISWLNNGFGTENYFHVGSNNTQWHTETDYYAADAKYSFGPINFALNASYTYVTFTCKFWESDGVFFLDDYIASHDNKPFTFGSGQFSQYSDTFFGFLPAEGGTAEASYYGLQ